MAQTEHYFGWLNVTNVTVLLGFPSGLRRVEISGANETNGTVQEGGVFCVSFSDFWPSLCQRLRHQ